MHTRRAPILAALALSLGGGMVLLGGRMIASDEPVLSDAEITPTLAVPSPTPAASAASIGEPDPAHTAEVPFLASPSRMVAPKIVAPPEVETGDLERAEPREPLSRLSLALPPPPKPKTLNKWSGTPFYRPVATGSARFESMNRSVTIAGADSLTSDETCLSEGVAWSCGMRARAAFRLWLRGRTVVCKLPEDEDRAEIVVPCRLGKQDVGAWLVSNGWARATPDGPYVQDGEKAQAARLGIFGEPPDTSGLPAVPSVPEASMIDQPILAE